MTLNFPTNPSVNDTYTYNGTTFVWDGEKWDASNPFLVNTANIVDDAVTPDKVAVGDYTFSAINGGPLAGLRNQLRNPLFSVFQRTSPVTVGTTYDSSFGADGWSVRGTSNTGGTTTLSAGFPGASIMSTYMSQTNASHNNYFYLRQKIESVTTLAGQTATLTLQLQTSVTFSLDPDLSQYFGTGGSDSVGISSNEGAQEVATGGIRTLSWTFNIPSIAGKTVDITNDSLNLQINSTAAVNGTIQWISAQLESGPIATPFEHRPIGLELSLCQRYFYSFSFSTQNDFIYCTQYRSDNRGATVQFPVTMRTSPTVDSALSVGAESFSSLGSNKYWIIAVEKSYDSSDGIYIAEFTADAEL